MKNFALSLIVFFAFITCYSQKEIIKNGKKINKLDNKDKKQGSWFFFDPTGNLELSCYYKNDSIVTPMVFYKNNDSAFVRFQKIDNSEIFLLKSSREWVVGTINTIKADSTAIEILGRYIKTGKNTFDIEEDTMLSNSISLKKEVEYWSNKQISPVYLFGTENLKDFYYRLFSSSKIVYNKRIVIDVSINETGLVEKIDFPGKLNNLNNEEESELSYLFSRMERWQPFFSKNKTLKYTVRLTLGTTLKN